MKGSYIPTKKIMKLDKRIRAVQGGSAASKTISVLLFLIHLAQSDKIPKLTSIVSESLPHLKKGAMRDFLSIMQQHIISLLLLLLEMALEAVAEI